MWKALQLWQMDFDVSKCYFFDEIKKHILFNYNMNGVLLQRVGEICDMRVKQLN